MNHPQNRQVMRHLSSLPFTIISSFTLQGTLPPPRTHPIKAEQFFEAVLVTDMACIVLWSGPQENSLQTQVANSVASPKNFMRILLTKISRGYLSLGGTRPLQWICSSVLAQSNVFSLYETSLLGKKNFFFSFFLKFCFSLTNSDLSRWQGAHLMPF